MLEGTEIGAGAQPTSAVDGAEAALWREWAATRDQSLRHRLIAHYSEWTRYMARRVFLRVRIPGVEWQDFVHYATIGLLESIDRFEPERGLQFETYARHRVRGAILNGLRECREQTRHDPQLSRQLERSESLDSGDTGDLLAEIVEISVGLAIGHLLDVGSMPSGDIYAQVERDCLMDDLAGLVASLPDKEQKVIHYHYFQHLAFTEIAELLGLTKGRISQLHKQGIGRIKKRLEAGDQLDIVA